MSLPTHKSTSHKRIAIIGAGIAGATCARLLADAGCEVQVFDKSRGVGGRMATRRAVWTTADGSARAVTFDHGVPGWTATLPAFSAWLQTAEDAGVARHAPDGSWVALPDMPALSRWLLAGIPLQTERRIDALTLDGTAWRLTAQDPLPEGTWDAVVVAIPPAQAANVWRTWRPDWADADEANTMSPCWTLMAITDEPAALSARLGDGMGDTGLPSPLSQVIRQDGRSGRPALAGGIAAWVVHADAAWSLAHQDAAPDDVRPQLQSALQQALGGARHWHHAVVHRWRYAQVASPGASVSPYRWDSSRGLGACGDHLGGGGVEGAWLSGHSLAQAIIGSSA